MKMPKELEEKLREERDLSIKRFTLAEIRAYIPKGASGADIDHILTVLEKKYESTTLR